MCSRYSLAERLYFRFTNKVIDKVYDKNGKIVEIWIYNCANPSCYLGNEKWITDYSQRLNRADELNFGLNVDNTP